MLSHPPVVRHSSIRTLRHGPELFVLLTPTWAGDTEGQRKDTQGLWSADCLDFAAAILQVDTLPFSKQPHRSLVLIPTWQDKIAVQHRQGESGLWSTECVSGEDSKEILMQEHQKRQVRGDEMGVY